MYYSRPSSCGVVFAAAVVLFAFFEHRTFTVSRDSAADLISDSRLNL